LFNRNFSILDVSLFTEELTNAIENDISIANRELDTDQCRQYLNDSFFKN